MKHFRHNFKKRDLCPFGCSRKGGLGREHIRAPVLSVEGGKDQEFPIIPVETCFR